MLHALLRVQLNTFEMKYIWGGGMAVAVKKCKGINIWKYTLIYFILK